MNEVIEAPITDVGFVTDPARIPSSYVVLDKTDSREIADLWPDKTFAWTKVTRYICYTRRNYDNKGTPANILVDVAIINDKEEVPHGFVICDQTLDTKEKAMKKSQLCFKYVAADTLPQNGVTDIIVIGRNKRPPIGFTLVGEMNNLLICYKLSRISTSTSIYSNRPTVPPPAPVYVAPLVQRSPSKPFNPLSGVPFELHNKYKNSSAGGSSDPFPILYKSRTQIETEFFYNFSVERGVLTVEH